MKNISQRLLDFNSERYNGTIGYKYRFMEENMFRFYRGTCHIFYEDLIRSEKLKFGPHCWITGDLHLENFGSYQGGNGLVYFDLNDFDEAILAPAAWELVRLVTSILVAFDSLNIDRERAIRLSKLFLKSYSETLAKGKARYIEANTSTGIVADFLNEASKRKQKALLDKKTVQNKKILLDHPSHLRLEKTLKKELMQHLEDWLKHDGDSPYNYRMLDVAFRIAGTSSVGVSRYAVLLRSTNRNGQKHLLLDMKQAIKSCVPAITDQPKWASQAERVLFAQQLMQNHPPGLLSSTEFRGNSFVIQEMQPIKDSINFRLLKERYRDMCLVIDSMGMLTASAQLRSAGRKGSDHADALVKFGEESHWRNEVLAYAMTYEEKVKKYFTDFRNDYRKVFEKN